MQLLGDNGFVTAKRHQPLLEHDDAKGFHFSFLVFTSENSIEFSETDRIFPSCLSRYAQ